MEQRAPVLKKEEPGLIAEMSSILNTLTRGSRILEERYDNLRKKIQMIEQNILTENKKIYSEVKTFEMEFNEIKREIADINEKITMIISELREGAKKEDVAVLEKYISVWEPLNFITRQEAERIIKDAIKEELSKKQ
jgi:DNA-binding HxlR family transcriptional regulator